MGNYFLKDGHIIDPSRNVDFIGDLRIHDGLVVEEGILTPLPHKEEIINCAKCVICPGFIDLRAHLGDPGREDVETILTGSLAAARGGFTAVACLPTTDPVNDSRAVTEYIREKARRESLVEILPLGAATVGNNGVEIAPIGEMYTGGIVGVSSGNRSITSAQLVRRIMEYLKSFPNLPYFSHACDESLEPDWMLHEGKTAMMLAIPGIPSAAEAAIVARDIYLSELTRQHVHFEHLSAKESVALVRAAKERQLKVTAGVSALHLLLTEDDTVTLEPNVKVIPPLRTIEDQKALIEGIRDGTIDVIVSDHFPQAQETKEVEFDNATFGASMLETTVPIVVDKLYHQAEIPLERIISLFTTNPARILKLAKYGALDKKQPANLTVIDLEQQFVVDSKKFLSKGKNTPINGRTLKGCAAYSFVKGQWIMSKGVILR